MPITKLLEEFTDIFPETLLDELPPSRRVDFKLNMKPDAVSSNRGPFRLSKVEQDALDLFVAGKLKKGWIEVSDSPWVPNIYGIPKKDPTSGHQLSRSE
ncbi:retrotransposon protein [Plasmopara halstedii]|uniref:Retrotransposon protein n=1 Tax=Plasmopara halstedii TaxID=4781 RepID=A0A0P1A4L3_PLAHL|nr:retrotransposon protein [Plasmopara halstedii]CEG35180.1 retrotransposon protein [Plasmopara halstedii]|eukprot:XP_024571549.1 retrotransposon protein [Plasmopara halstedii]